MAMKRRDFLTLSAGTALFPIGCTAWAADGGPRRLIVIMLRGAVDGLNVVVPYGERAYYEARPTIAIGRPGTDQGALSARRSFWPAPCAHRPAAAVEREKARFCPRRRLARSDAIAF